MTASHAGPYSGTQPMTRDSAYICDAVRTPFGRYGGALAGTRTDDLAAVPLKALLATFSKDKGMGAANRGRYSNPKLDAVLGQALATVNDAQREKLLQQATEIGVGDLGIIPLYHQHNLWAARRGIVYEARSDERTFAHEFRPQ